MRDEYVHPHDGQHRTGETRASRPAWQPAGEEAREDDFRPAGAELPIQVASCIGRDR
jgi:hypothetical protein